MRSCLQGEQGADKTKLCGAAHWAHARASLVAHNRQAVKPFLSLQPSWV